MISTDDVAKRLTRVPFLFILLGVAVYFWVNGPAFFENWSDTYGTTIIYYIGMMVVFLYFAKANTIKSLKEPLGTSAYKYAKYFFGTWVLVNILVLLGVLSAGAISPDVAWQVILIQVGIVSVAEELMFRGVLQDYVGIIPQAALFSIWHSAAYGVLWYNFPSIEFGSLMFTFVFGLLMGYLVKEHKKNVGLVGTVSIHACWNLCV